MSGIEVAFGVVGVVGVLGQIFDGCLKAYRIFTTATSLGRDSERLVCKVRIEEMRLVVWGREWGVAEGKLEHHLSSVTQGQEGMKEIAETILRQLYGTIMDFNRLRERYGLREEAPGSVDREAYGKGREDPGVFGRRNGVGKEFKLRARWVIADKEKFEELLEELRYYNEKLEGLFPASKIVALQRTWRNELLEKAERDLEGLTLLESASLTRYPSLNTFAQLKQLRINLDAREPNKKLLSSSEIKIQTWRLTTEGGASDNRTIAVYKKPIDTMVNGAVSEDVPVLVEWIGYEPEMDLDARLHLYQRVDNLARMLHSSAKRHPDLHTLDCIGYVDDTANNRYGLLHLPPTTESPTSPQHQTLSDLIKSANRRTPDLDVRFALAKTLSVALWSFHSLDWLHKAFCSPNVLFFNNDPSSTTEAHDLSCPYVVGFDSSRPDHLHEMTAVSRIDAPETIYRHPNSLGVWRQPYRKAFDIYSLGLMLLEIGLWKSIKTIHKEKYLQRPADFREKVVQGMVPALGSKTGGAYRRVVERCLRYEEGGEGESMNPHMLMEWVVLTLEGLKV